MTCRLESLSRKFLTYLSFFEAIYQRNISKEYKSDRVVQEKTLA